jgi:SP family sugar:H+ symporter-like MFS transporter
MTFGGLYVVERFGRRWPLIIGGIWQAAWMAVFASMGTALDPENNSTSGIVMIVAAAMFIASFAMTWGPIAWVVIGETFPLRTRAKQASIATAGNWLGNCKPSSFSSLSLFTHDTNRTSKVMISFLTPLATSGISYAYGYVFVGTNLAATLVAYFFLYESVSLSLENVDAMYSQPQLKPWTSRKWMPEGYLTRMDRDEEFFRRRVDIGDGEGKHGGEDLDDRTTAVPSGRPSRATVDEQGAGPLEKRRSESGDLPAETREERVRRAV